VFPKIGIFGASPLRLKSVDAWSPRNKLAPKRVTMNLVALARQYLILYEGIQIFGSARASPPCDGGVTDPIVTYQSPTRVSVPNLIAAIKRYEYIYVRRSAEKRTLVSHFTTSFKAVERGSIGYQ